MTATGVATPAVGVIGGSGFYALLDDYDEVVVDTPFGAPSEPVAIGDLAGRQVAFLPRHGRDHRFPPHRVPYRANLWALREVGVTQVLAPCASGSLRGDVRPGSFVVCDQLVDRTSGRPGTVYDDRAVHVSFADPYCAQLRAVGVAEARALDIEVHDGGTMVVIEGPRFSTRAESRWYAAQGWSVVNMTGAPEAALARELELCYSSIALVTDFDAGAHSDDGALPAVTADEVARVFADNNVRLRGLLHSIVGALPMAPRTCPCATALQGAAL